jgi:hypothetical protein
MGYRYGYTWRFAMNQFSYFEGGVTKVYPVSHIDIQKFIEMLGREQLLVTQARATSDKEKRDSIKRRMNYVTFGGTFKRRGNENLIKSSGYACFDIDNLTDVMELKDKLITDKYTHLLFVSPSGNGLKLIFKIPEVKSDEEYKEYWNSISQYLNLPAADEKTKDIARACFMSFDDEAYFNPDSEIYTDKIKMDKKAQSIIIKTKDHHKSANSKKKYEGSSNDFLDKLKSNISMGSVLSKFGVDISCNPTNCPFHYCSQRCFSFNSEVCHCFDSDCNNDDSWNIFSFVKKVNNCDSADAIKWLAEFAGMEDEYEKAKQEYIESQTEPRGWANSISIVKMAKNHSYENCHVCDSQFEFNDKIGWFKCDKCNIKGGLTKFATLITYSAKTKQWEDCAE